jgi:hypothetical protein
MTPISVWSDVIDIISRQVSRGLPLADSSLLSLQINSFLDGSYAFASPSQPSFGFLLNRYRARLHELV